MFFQYICNCEASSSDPSEICPFAGHYRDGSLSPGGEPRAQLSKSPPSAGLDLILPPSLSGPSLWPPLPLFCVSLCPDCALLITVASECTFTPEDKVLSISPCPWGRLFSHLSSLCIKFHHSHLKETQNGWDFSVTALMLQNLGGPASCKVKHLDVGRMAVSRLYQQHFGSSLDRVPLWELWDPATFAKGPGRGHAHLFLR